METFIFRAEIEQDEEGTWEAEIPVLPGCAVWGYTREEALEAMQDVAQVFVEIMLEGDEKVPTADTSMSTHARKSDVSTYTTITAAIPLQEKLCHHCYVLRNGRKTTCVGWV